MKISNEDLQKIAYSGSVDDLSFFTTERDVLKVIAEELFDTRLYRVDYRDKWIPVDVGKIEEDVYYLVWADGEGVMSAFYSPDGEWRCYIDAINDYITLDVSYYRPCPLAPFFFEEEE